MKQVTLTWTLTESELEKLHSALNYCHEKEEPYNLTSIIVKLIDSQEDSEGWQDAENSPAK